MKITIIGNGISGITAARWLRKLSDHEITVISAETDHFYSRTALMYIYMGHMQFKDTQPYEPWFWEKNRINLVRARVENVDFQQKKLQLSKAVQVNKTKAAPPTEISYDKLIIATGSSPNKFGWPGQDLKGVSGLYSYQDLEHMEEHSDGLKRAVIVGGGLIGIEMAEMFHSRKIPATILVREENYWNNVLPVEESKMVSRHIEEHHFDLRLETELKEIIDDGNGKACAVITSKGERIECGYVGLTAGVHPNINFLKESGLEIGRGIKVNQYLETSQKDVYAIGDCAEQTQPQEGRRGIEAIWYTGRMMGETAAYNICGKQVVYNPGIWFNSAKFLDIEYQVYGNVLAHPPENHTSLYWEDNDGKKSIRIVYDKNDHTIIGFNLMGVRYRHEMCEKWIKEKAPLKEVLQNLGAANFDPEFFKQYEQQVINIYNKQNPENPISLKRKRGLKGFLELMGIS
jgi:NADPH-dependent 2,4-dienoyl-CoA reductase/sulfur reductase-like enzyme